MPIFCLWLGVSSSSDYTQPITDQVTKVTCLVIGQALPELTPNKRQKTGPGNIMLNMDTALSLVQALPFTEEPQLRAHVNVWITATYVFVNNGPGNGLLPKGTKL